MIVYEYAKAFLDLSTEEGMEKLRRLGMEGWKLEAVTSDYVILSQRGMNLSPGYTPKNVTPAVLT